MKKTVYSVLACIASSAGVCSADIPAEQSAYFEQHIRPVLIENCYECHGGQTDKLKGDFNLTFREGLRTSGEIGNNVVPDAPDQSALLEAMRYQDSDFQMPPSGKLPDEVIQYFEEWIAMGAPDPRDTVLKPDEETLETVWDATLEQRKKWWSYQPILQPQVPEVPAPWNANPIDAFLQQALTEAGLEASPLANPNTLIRRLSFVLTGLAPTQDEVNAFVLAANIDQQAAVNGTVNRLMASPHFGERWARHWMDWVRYAETHGSEEEPYIPHAWRYRDYLIRALNADVPYDDLVREQLAGDLMPEPRINEELGIQESLIGPAQYRFVLHGYSPTDPLDEFVRFTDNQVDTVSKAFLATTVSCARCHNHKFDPVSQKDFYAFFGVMASTRPATVIVDTEERLNLHKETLSTLKQDLRRALAEQWLGEVNAFALSMDRPDDILKKALAESTAPRAPLHAWQQLHTLKGPVFEEKWQELKLLWENSADSLAQRRATSYPVQWDLGQTDAAQTWTQYGNGLDSLSVPAGEFHLLPKGDRLIQSIYPAGIYTHLLSTKHSGVLSSPRFTLSDSNLYLRMAGDRQAVARYVVQNYPRDGVVYPSTRINGKHWRWQHWNVDYWQGESAYLELSTAPDQAILVNDEEVRSWFGITEAIMTGKDQPAPKDEVAEFVSPLFESKEDPSNATALRNLYAESLRTCIIAWRDQTMSNEQARYLNEFLQNGLLGNRLGASDDIDALAHEYRRLEAEIPVPTRAPGVVENTPIDHPLYTRGDPKRPEEPVSRRFLEAFDSRPFGSQNSGRLELAEHIVGESNPLASRVIVNRLWHHTFGQGLVTTPDDFGAMGQKPSHPELLDYLARGFMAQGWSIKSFIRSLVTSRTFQLSATPVAKANEVDPNNALLSHAHVRRLEGEAIRDALLMAGGQLNLETPQGSVGGQSDRRSVYVRVERNELDPFLTTFDAPVPISTKGRRDTTNVPTHALTLMNDPFVRTQAEALAQLIYEDKTLNNTNDRLAAMFARTLGRKPMMLELEAMQAYLVVANQRPDSVDYDPVLAKEIHELTDRETALKVEIKQLLDSAVAKDPDLAKLSKRKQGKKIANAQLKEQAQIKRRLFELEPLAGAPTPWVELAHSLFNLKEFTYLR